MNRGLQILKNVKMIRHATRNISTSVAKNSGQFLYRDSAKGHIPKHRETAANVVGAIMWYWILIHLWHEPEHITGDFPYPDPSKWTNEELGI